MKTCPYCQTEIIVKELPHPEVFKNYGICPKCNGSFTVDTDTKYRQALCLIIGIMSLVFTLFLYFDNNDWLIPAIASYVALGFITYWGNKKLYFVPYKKQVSSDDT